MAARTPNRHTAAQKRKANHYPKRPSDAGRTHADMRVRAGPGARHPVGDIVRRAVPGLFPGRKALCARSRHEIGRAVCAKQAPLYHPAEGPDPNRVWRKGSKCWPQESSRYWLPAVNSTHNRQVILHWNLVRGADSSGPWSMACRFLVGRPAHPSSLFPTMLSGWPSIWIGRPRASLSTGHGSGAFNRRPGACHWVSARSNA